MSPYHSEATAGGMPRELDAWIGQHSISTHICINTIVAAHNFDSTSSDDSKIHVDGKSRAVPSSTANRDSVKSGLTMMQVSYGLRSVYSEFQSLIWCHVAPEVSFGGGCLSMFCLFGPTVAPATTGANAQRPSCPATTT